MSVQVSTRIDEETKKELDVVCRNIGLTTSAALGMLVKFLIKHNGIPFPVISKPKENKPIRGSGKGLFWIAEDFDEPLEDFQEYME